MTTPETGDVLRPARPEEGVAVAELWLRSRKASVPANPPPAYDDDNVRRHFATEVVGVQEVWVVERAGRGLLAMLVVHGGRVEHLMVDPDVTGQGIGSRLIELAKSRAEGSLDLWTFQSNLGARRFYERHGFEAVETTDDDNVEKAPDVRYRWVRA